MYAPAPRTRSRRAPLLARPLLLAAALLMLVACGGGGGGVPGTPAPVYVDGLSGDVLLPGFDLGRIIEQEPNDSRAQPFALPPVWPRSRLEVTGELGTTAAWTGRVDPVDVLGFTTVRPQFMSLELDFLATDPISSSANDFRAEVVRRATGVSVAVTGAGLPRTLTFDAAANDAYDIVVTAVTGHGWYVLRLVGDDSFTAPVFSKPSAAAIAMEPAAESKPGACAGTHVLVRFAEGCDAEAVCAREGLTLGRRTGTGSYRVLLPCAAAGEAAAGALCEHLRGMPGIERVEPDWIVTSLGLPADPEFNRQWNLRAIGAPSAWDVERGDEDVVVAVVDAGVTEHPDLVGRLVPGYDFVSGVPNAADGDGRDPDPTDPGDRASSSGLSTWHGTHVCAIIAGQDDAYGCTGLAPGCRVMMLRAIGVGGGFVSDAADAILYAAGLFTTLDGHSLPAPVRIINLSIGLDAESEELRDACDRAANRGCFLVAAVGNKGGAVQAPARYASTFAVSAVDGKLLTTSYSNFGTEVDIAAPGGGQSVDQWNDGWHDGVLSAVRDETIAPSTWSHAYLVGTSQAAPHVAAAAALLLSLDPTLTSSDIATVLRTTALDLGLPGQDVAYGAGLLQVHEAVRTVLARLGNPRSDAPYLMLPTRSVQFEGLRTSLDLPLWNGGGGKVNVFFAIGRTDDGTDWLSGTLTPDARATAPVNMKRVTIQVDPGRLPTTPGAYSGSLFLANSQGTLATIRVVAYVQARTRAGQVLPLVAIEDDTEIARGRAFAYPEFGYRYWIRKLPASVYRLQAGEDLDADGFFCEAADACGWLGGPTEADAIPVEFVPNQPAVRGLSIELATPP